MITLALILPFLAPQEKLAAYKESLPKSLTKIDMLPVPAGKVTIKGKSITLKPFYMSKTEVAWEAFDVFVASGAPSKPYDQTPFGPDVVARPSKSYILPDRGWGHAGWPAICLSITNVEMFCRWLSSATKKKYRLATEAEWEYACRAGNTATWKPVAATAAKESWFATNSKSMTHPVAKKAANKWGFYDMLGNAGEWCTDMDGKPVQCGPTYRDKLALVTPGRRQYWEPAWQEEDPQIPKSRWWLSDATFAGFRLVCEP